MSLLEPQLIFPHVGGINRIAAREALPDHETDDTINTYPDHDGLLKRPGTVQTIATRITTDARGIFDMVRFAMIPFDDIGSLVTDSLYCLYNRSGSTFLAIARLNGADFSSFAEIINEVDSSVPPGVDIGSAELIPASFDMIQVTTRRDGAVNAERKLEFRGATGLFQISANTTQGAYRTAAWHRDHLIGADAGVDRRVHEFGWSDTADPRTHPALNREDIRPFGHQDHLTGVKSIGDILYLIKQTSLWAMTGAAQELWRLERLTTSIGGFSSKSAVDVGGVMMGIAVAPTWGEGANAGSQYPDNIYAVKGFAVDLVGHKVRPIIQAAFPQQIPPSDGEMDDKNQKAVYWASRELALFFLKTPLSTERTSEAVVFSKTNGTWWNWTFPSTTAGPNSAEYHNRTIYLGGKDGRIRNFVDSAPDDDGTTFVSQWTSRRIFGPDREKKYALESTIIKGAQTSGGNSTVAVAREEGGFVTVFSPTLGSTSRGEFKKLNGFNSARYWRIRVTFPTAGVQSKIRWVQYQLKDMGKI
ncbi:hypothetical protein LCGC14_0450820 [marine sediment metagenome]|uniref:Uncharacterized protein n=1 Tax=marine sediment metagenome TaxID=412755 RepID=A0A0F9V4J5_9ZZZZ